MSAKASAPRSCALVMVDPNLVKSFLRAALSSLSRMTGSLPICVRRELNVRSSRLLGPRMGGGTMSGSFTGLVAVPDFRGSKEEAPWLRLEGAG